jgi:hypothetical protein
MIDEHHPNSLDLTFRIARGDRVIAGHPYIQDRSGA